MLYAFSRRASRPPSRPRMHAGKLVSAQLTDLIHPEQFHRCVRRYDGDYKVKTFSCWNQFPVHGFSANWPFERVCAM